MATHSSILAWRIPWTEEPVGLQSTGCRVGHDRATSLSLFSATRCSMWDLNSPIRDQTHASDAVGSVDFFKLEDNCFKLVLVSAVHQCESALSIYHLLLEPTRFLSMGFSRQEYWSGLAFPSPALPSQPRSALQMDSLPSQPSRKPIRFFHLTTDSILLFYG